MATFHDLLAAAKAEITEVDTAEAQRRVEAGGVVVLDVREPDEYDQGALPNAVHIPRGHLEAQVEGRIVDKSAPVVVRADGATHWTQGEYEVWALRGHCRIEQGDIVAVGDEGVLWVDRADTFSGRLLRASAVGYGGVVRNGTGPGDADADVRGATFRVKARAWMWPLLSHELVKGTAELICLHGLNTLDDATYASERPNMSVHCSS